MATPATMNTYGDRTTTIVRGEGPYLWDREGRRYIDAISGIAVCGLGYSYAAVTNALCEQAKTLLHCSNLYVIEPQQELGALLADIAGMENAFFSNSGAEANEAALKIARKFGQQKGIAEPEVITATKSFHGRTMATLSATGNDKIKDGFAPLLSGFVHADYNDVEAITQAATPNTVAVMIEPIQGEGGIRIPSEHYLEEVRAVCDANGWLLILDEIQCGNGRTGKYFAFQHSRVVPDILTTAKGLGNGVPIGACLARGAAAEILQPGNHGSTFGGNPLACATALAVVREINQEERFTRIKDLGERMLSRLQDGLQSEPNVVDIRGKGLMLAIELAKDCGELVEQAKTHQVLLNVTSGNVIRLLPPFVLSDEDADYIVDTVVSLVKAFVHPQPEASSANPIKKAASALSKIFGKHEG